MKSSTVSTLSLFLMLVVILVVPAYGKSQKSKMNRPAKEDRNRLHTLEKILRYRIIARFPSVVSGLSAGVAVITGDPTKKLDDIENAGYLIWEESSHRINEKNIQTTFKMRGGSSEEVNRKGYRAAIYFEEKKITGPQGILSIQYSGYMNRHGKELRETIQILPDRLISRVSGKEPVEKRGSFMGILSLMDFIKKNGMGKDQSFAFVFNGESYELGLAEAEEENIEVNGNPYPVTRWEFTLKSLETGKMIKNKGEMITWVAQQGPYRGEVIRFKVKYSSFLTLIGVLEPQT
ncbi:MAG TPA: hypothetical protein VNM22_21075 [Candidatus Limnocylindrales bacterium]|nr:hypothetical protein [Candidatus Limnocylindrales bacterium]